MSKWEFNILVFGLLSTVYEKYKLGEMHFTVKLKPGSKFGKIFGKFRKTVFFPEPWKMWKNRRILK